MHEAIGLERFSELVELILRPRHEGELHALGGERLRDCAPDPTARAGDNCDFSCEFEIHHTEVYS